MRKIKDRGKHGHCNARGRPFCLCLCGSAFRRIGLHGMRGIYVDRGMKGFIPFNEWYSLYFSLLLPYKFPPERRNHMRALRCSDVTQRSCQKQPHRRDGCFEVYSSWNCQWKHRLKRVQERTRIRKRRESKSIPRHAAASGLFTRS